MARLAFFTEQLPSVISESASDPAVINEFSYGLMVALADQQHDVRVFSTYREGETLPPSHTRLQIVRPFRKWGWLEIPRLIPILLDFQPEILHFIQPRKEVFSGLTNAMSAIPAMAPMIGRPKVVVSMYDVRKKELQRNRLLLVTADVVIVANKQQADELATWFAQQPRQAQIEIVSLPQTLSAPAPDSTVSEVLPGLDQLEARDVIYIPGELGEHRDLPALARVLNDTLKVTPKAGLIFGGGWGDLPLNERRDFMRSFEDAGHGARLVLTGPLTSGGEQACLDRASVVLLAGLSESTLQLARFIRLALNAHKPLILSDAQQRLDPMRWRHKENAYVVANSPESWGETLATALLDEGLRREIRSRLPDFARTEAVDEPGNAMSRIYAQVLRNIRR